MDWVTKMTDIYFFTALQAEKSKVKVLAGFGLQKLSSWLVDSCCVLTWRREWFSFSSLSKGQISFMELGLLTL